MLGKYLLIVNRQVTSFRCDQLFSTCKMDVNVCDCIHHSVFTDFARMKQYGFTFSHHMQKIHGFDIFPCL